MQNKLKISTLHWLLFGCCFFHSFILTRSLQSSIECFWPFSRQTDFRLYCISCFAHFFWRKKHHEKKIPSTRLHSILQKRPLPTNASRKDTDRVFVLILFTYFFYVFSHCTAMGERNIFPILFSCHITKFTRFARLIEHVQPAKTTMKTYDCQMCMCSNACYFYKFIIITD